MIKYLKKLFKKKQLEDELYNLETNPEYQDILRKYNIKPVYGSIQPKIEQEEGLTSSNLKTSKAPVSKKPKKPKKVETRYVRLKRKFGDEVGERLYEEEIWLGMTEKMLVELKGKPGKRTESVTKNKKKEELYFEGSKNRQGNLTFKFKAIMINGELEKWTTY